MVDKKINGFPLNRKQSKKWKIKSKSISQRPYRIRLQLNDSDFMKNNLYTSLHYVEPHRYSEKTDQRKRLYNNYEAFKNYKAQNKYYSAPKHRTIPEYKSKMQKTMNRK